MTENTPSGAPEIGAPIRVMAVDDHALFRDGIATLLGTHPELRLVAEASNGTEAIERYRELRPDVTLMDLSMPIMSGVEAIRRIVSEFHDARILALTTYQGDTDIYRALEAGARGYLIKDALRHEVADAIRTIARGGRVLPAVVAQRLAEYSPRVDLTEREVEVLALMAQGLENTQIAESIGRSVATVKAHVHHILTKLGANDRTEAVVVALQRGIIHLT